MVVCSKSGRSSPLMRPFWSFLESRAKFLRSKVHFLDLQVCCDWSTFFPLVSADVCSGGLRDEPVINWQLLKQVVRWPVSHDRIAGSGVSHGRNLCIWSYPLTSYLFFNLFTGASPCLNLYIITGSECVRVLYHQALFQNTSRVKMKKHIFFKKINKYIF